MKKILLISFFTSLLFIGGCQSTPVNYDAFATCLTDAGAKMYGTDWCTHCQDQKRLFGNSFDKINFINCDEDEFSCNLASIQGYPTWVLESGEKLVGTQDLKTLAEKTNCPLP